MDFEEIKSVENFNGNSAQYALLEADYSEWWPEKFLPIIKSIEEWKLVGYYDDWTIEKKFSVELKDWTIIYYDWGVHKDCIFYETFDDFLKNIPLDRKELMKQNTADLVEKLLETGAWKEAYKDFLLGKN